MSVKNKRDSHVTLKTRKREEYILPMKITFLHMIDWFLFTNWFSSKKNATKELVNYLGKLILLCYQKFYYL